MKSRSRNTYISATVRARATCARCGTTRGPFEADHIRRLVDGGPDTIANLRCLCRGCHDRGATGDRRYGR